jgi:hypothetical protein
MKYIVWLIISLWVGCQWAYSNDTLINGGIDSIINIKVETDNQLKNQVSDLRTQSSPSNGSVVARIYCDNNNYNGFSLTFVSDRFGRLVFFKNNEYPSQEKDGHFIAYTLDLVRGETGQLGVDMPDEINRSAFQLSQPHVILFNQNVLESTHQAELLLKMHTQKKLSLFHGVFQDTITVTIADL